MEKTDSNIDFTQFEESGLCVCYEPAGDEDVQDEGFESIDLEQMNELCPMLNSQLKAHNLIILETWNGGDPGMGVMYMVMPLDEFNEKRK